MESIKIGIITCANATQDMNCCSVSCLRDLHKRLGSFQNYPPDIPLHLVGMISCAGCPTKAYPEKILRRVNSLVQFKVTHLHFANCMMAFCPFLSKYTDAIKREYPDIQLIEGTHKAHNSNEVFREKLVCAFQSKKDMPDIILGKI
jgi:predicted metal-binding protein